tara:strand:- start:964 stop:2460 length:1497 start_codon:yes stop_codon:yes gene_type:complete
MKNYIERCISSTSAQSYSSNREDIIARVILSIQGMSSNHQEVFDKVLSHASAPGAYLSLMTVFSLVESLQAFSSSYSDDMSQLSPDFDTLLIHLLDLSPSQCLAHMIQAAEEEVAHQMKQGIPVECIVGLYDSNLAWLKQKIDYKRLLLKLSKSPTPMDDSILLEYMVRVEKHVLTLMQDESLTPCRIRHIENFRDNSTLIARLFLRVDRGVIGSKKRWALTQVILQFKVNSDIETRIMRAIQALKSKWMLLFTHALYEACRPNQRQDERSYLEEMIKQDQSITLTSEEACQCLLLEPCTQLLFDLSKKESLDVVHYCAIAGVMPSPQKIDEFCLQHRAASVRGSDNIQSNVAFLTRLSNGRKCFMNQEYNKDSLLLDFKSSCSSLSNLQNYLLSNQMMLKKQQCYTDPTFCVWYQGELWWVLKLNDIQDPGIQSILNQASLAVVSHEDPRLTCASGPLKLKELESSMVQRAFIEHRHDSPQAQRQFDQWFGLTLQTN